MTAPEGNGEPAAGRGRAATLAVTSGKGGVGKTSLATNLGIELSRHGHRVCLLDADLGLANVNILLGLEPRYTLEDVIDHGRAMSEVILRAPGGLDVVPAASEIRRLHRTSADTAGIADHLAALERDYDYLIIDTPAGVSPSTLDFVRACDHVILTITQEPTSLTDAFSLLKAIQARDYTGSVNLVVNMLPPDRPGRALFERFNAAAERYLKQSLGYLGALPMDPAVTRAVLAQEPLLLHTPGSAAAAAIATLATTLERTIPAGRGTGHFSRFWARLGRARSDPAEPVSAPVPAPPDSSTDAGEIPEPAVAEPEPAPATGDETSTAATAGTADDEPAASPGTDGDRTAEPRDLDELTETVTALLTAEDVDERAARRFFGAVERAFTRRFRRRSGDVKALVYEALLQGTLSAEQQRDLLQTLFLTYRRQHGHSRDHELALPDLAELPTEALLDALQPLNLRLAVDGSLAQRLLTGWLREALGGSDWRREDSRVVLEELARQHHRRFGEPLHLQEPVSRESGDDG